MHFCKSCGNMYYIKLNKTDEDGDETLMYYCRKCNYEDTELSNNLDNLYVSKTNLSKSSNNKSRIINEFTKYDPTLPRTNKIVCPNDECENHVKKNEEETSENYSDIKKQIIYIRYDDTNMKYMYLCPVCDTSWEN